MDGRMLKIEWRNENQKNFAVIKLIFSVVIFAILRRPWREDVAQSNWRSCCRSQSGDVLHGNYSCYIVIFDT